jgi:hypothetical protein
MPCCPCPPGRLGASPCALLALPSRHNAAEARGETPHRPEFQEERASMKRDPESSGSAANPPIWLLLCTGSLLELGANDCWHPCRNLGGRGIQGDRGQPLPVRLYINMFFLIALPALAPALGCSSSSAALTGSWLGC